MTLRRKNGGRGESGSMFLIYLAYHQMKFVYTQLFCLNYLIRKEVMVWGAITDFVLQRDRLQCV